MPGLTLRRGALTPSCAKHDRMQDPPKMVCARRHLPDKPAHAIHCLMQVAGDTCIGLPEHLTRSIEVAQLPKICSGNHSHTWSLIPVASSLKSTVLLKTGRRLQPVTWSLILLVRSAQFWKGQGENGPRLFLLRRWTCWDGTGPLALGPCHASMLHLPNDERGLSYRGSSVPPACPIGALRHNALL